jgi:hypothetical protein
MSEYDEFSKRIQKIRIRKEIQDRNAIYKNRMEKLQHDKIKHSYERTLLPIFQKTIESFLKGDPNLVIDSKPTLSSLSFTVSYKNSSCTIVANIDSSNILNIKGFENNNPNLNTQVIHRGILNDSLIKINLQNYLESWYEKVIHLY